MAWSGPLSKVSFRLSRPQVATALIIFLGGRHTRDGRRTDWL